MKQRLNLKDLKVRSFVTSLDGNEEERIKGMGGDTMRDCTLISFCYMCMLTEPPACATNNEIC